MGALDSWRFCPVCGEAIEKVDDRAECRVCGYIGYANPVPGAEAVCFDEQGRILLGRRAFDPGQGLWDLPGGFSTKTSIRSTRCGGKFARRPGSRSSRSTSSASGSSPTTGESCSASRGRLRRRATPGPATTSSSCAGSSRTTSRRLQSWRSRITHQSCPLLSVGFRDSAVGSAGRFRRTDGRSPPVLMAAPQAVPKWVARGRVRHAARFGTPPASRARRAHRRPPPRACARRRRRRNDPPRAAAGRRPGSTGVGASTGSTTRGCARTGSSRSSPRPRAK